MICWGSDEQPLQGPGGRCGRGGLGAEEISVDVKPDPEHNVPGGKTSGRAISACTVQAQFNADGTYTWHEQHQGEGASKGLNFSFWVPNKESESLPAGRPCVDSLSEY